MNIWSDHTEGDWQDRKAKVHQQNINEDKLEKIHKISCKTSHIYVSMIYWDDVKTIAHRKPSFVWSFDFERYATNKKKRLVWFLRFPTKVSLRVKKRKKPLWWDQILKPIDHKTVRCRRNQKSIFYFRSIIRQISHMSRTLPSPVFYEPHFPV